MLRSFSSFKSKGDLLADLDIWEAEIRKYEDGAQTTVADDIDIAVLPDGIEDDQLRDQLQLNINRLPTYLDIVQEVTAVRMTKHRWETALSGETIAMDCDALQRKGGEKGKGDDKDKPKCNVCGKFGHYARATQR